MKSWGVQIKMKQHLQIGEFIGENWCKKNWSLYPNCLYTHTHINRLLERSIDFHFNLRISLEHFSQGLNHNTRLITNSASFTIRCLWLLKLYINIHTHRQTYRKFHKLPLHSQDDHKTRLVTNSAKSNVCLSRCWVHRWREHHSTVVSCPVRLGSKSVCKVKTL